MAGLEGTIHTPMGNVQKKTALIVGVGGGGVLLIAYYRSKKNAASASTSTSTDTSQSATDSSNIDPATGFPYGSPEDVAALQQQQLAGGGFGPVFGGGNPGGGQPGTPGTFTTNAEWSQYAEDYLVNTVGLSATDVGLALGKYLTGQPVTSDQVTIINQAIAFAGPVPVPGGNGNPPGFTEVQGGTNVAVPNVVGMETDAGQRAIVAAGLTVNRSQKLQPGRGSTIVSQSPTGGTQVAKGSAVTITIKEK